LDGSQSQYGRGEEEKKSLPLPHTLPTANKSLENVTKFKYTGTTLINQNFTKK